MSNVLVTAMHAQGMGALGSDFSIHDWGHSIGLNPVDSGGGGGFNWLGFANTVGGTLSNIFGNRNNNTNAAAQQLALLQAQQAAALAAGRNNSSEDEDEDSDSGIGIKFESNHLRIGGAKIPYSLLMIGGAAVLLLQSPGFQRRGR